MASDAIVEDYLRTLDRELAGLPRTRRRELVEEIRGHIAQAMAEDPPDSEADVLSLLDRIGDPSEIAEEAGARPDAARPRSRALEVIALVLLLPGSLVLPVVGWLAGVVMLWVSSIWTLRDKLIGTLLVPGGLLPALLLLFGWGYSEVCTATTDAITGEMREVCSGGPTGAEQALVTLGFVLVAVMPFVTTGYLALRLRSYSTRGRSTRTSLS